MTLRALIHDTVLVWCGLAIGARHWWLLAGLVVAVLVIDRDKQ